MARASRAWQGNLFLGWSGCLGKSWRANDEGGHGVKEWEPVADRPCAGQVFVSSSHSSICGIGDSHDLGILL